VTTPAVEGTISARQGQVLVVPSTLYHPDGTTVVDLTPVGTTVTFEMFSQGGSPIINALATILNAAGGVVQYTGTTADTAAAGSFVSYFVVTIPGQSPVAYPADGITVTIYPAVGALTGPQEGPCFPWTTPDAVRSAVTGIDPNADLTEWIEAASQVLYALTGRQYKGLCRATIRPGHKSCSCGGMCSAHLFGWPFLGAWGYGPYGLGGGYFGPYGLNMLYRGQEGPQNILLCASEIDLGHEARSVESIKIDGTEIDPTTWRLDPLGKLIRQPDSAGNRLVWPCCTRVDVPSGGIGTFEVTYVYGVDPPTDVVMAVNVMAGQFWLALNQPSQCKLPAHMQTMTRQGVTATFITDTTVYLSKGFTGIAVIDQIIAAHNPNHLFRRAKVLDIDVMSNRRMTP
jgi:hypothetical protein